MKKYILIILCLVLIGCAGGMPKSVSICILGHQEVTVEQPTVAKDSSASTPIKAEIPVSVVPK